MSSELQTEPSAEVGSRDMGHRTVLLIRGRSHDHVRESTNVCLLSLLLTAVDVQTFLGLYKRLFTDCTTVVSVCVCVCVRECVSAMY